MKQQKKWLKPRHTIIRKIAYPILRPYILRKYGITIEKFPNKEKRQFLILLNHQTVFDQFFVDLAMNSPVYYLATEDIFSKGCLFRRPFFVGRYCIAWKRGFAWKRNLA